jgi:hypothetical protein
MNIRTLNIILYFEEIIIFCIYRSGKYINHFTRLCST